jgi:hypothetical protein
MRLLPGVLPAVFPAVFPAIEPTAAERAATLPGDEYVPDADVVMDRAFSVPGPPQAVWPWVVQLGKERAGWYFPGWAERWIPPRRRGLRVLDARLTLAPGDVIPDWGGPRATFHVAVVDPPTALVHRSARGTMRMSWAITLAPEGAAGTRLHLRLRLSPVRRRWLAMTGGELIDQLTIAGLAAGLRERVRAPGVRAPGARAPGVRAPGAGPRPGRR